MKNKLLFIVPSLILFFLPNINFAQAPDLGSASGFVLFTSAGAFNANGASTIVTGDVGTNAGAFAAFPPGILVGNIHVADPVSAQAATDVNLAYGSMSTTICGSVISTTLGGGQMLLPNVYCMGAASTVNGDLILDGQGDPASLFIFKIDGALATTVGSRILLTNSASICNVWWQVNGEVDLGDSSLFQGTLLVNGAINILEGASLLGRGLSKAGAIELHNNVVTLGLQPTASIISAGGATTFCAGDSVILSGNIGGTWGNGATTSSITVYSSGDYFVTNTNACGSATSNHIVVSISQPLSCHISGNNSICQGQTTQLCAASGSVSYLWSTGDTTSFINVSAAGTYSVTVTNASGCSSTCSKIVSVNALPVCTVTGNGSICQGQSNQLCAPSGTSFYLWSTGATTTCINGNIAGIYSVTVTNANGCNSTCSKTVNLSCTITGNSTICPGASTPLCAPTGINYSYLWSTGSTTSCISVNAAGTYSVTVTNAGGCSSTCSKIVIVSTPPGCTITGNGCICQGQSTQLCATAGFSAYLWNTGETTSCINANSAGTYSVTVINSSGCLGSCNKVVTYPLRKSSGANNIPVGDGNIEANAYPNPFGSKAVIEFQNTEFNSRIVIELYSLTGNKIATLFKGDIEQGVLYKAEVNAENLPAGIYIYKIINGNQIINRKLILIK